MREYQMREHGATPHASIDWWNVETCADTSRHERAAPHPRGAQTNAACPVIARPTMSVFTSRVPSYE